MDPGMVVYAIVDAITPRVAPSVGFEQILDHGRGVVAVAQFDRASIDDQRPTRMIGNQPIVFEANSVGLPRPREASHPAAASARSTFSSAPHVRARAIASGAGSVLRAMAFAIVTSDPVGLTVTATVSPERRRVGLARLLAVIRMAKRSKK